MERIFDENWPEVSSQPTSNTASSSASTSSNPTPGSVKIEDEIAYEHAFVQRLKCQYLAAYVLQNERLPKVAGLSQHVAKIESARVDFKSTSFQEKRLKLSRMNFDVLRSLAPEFVVRFKKLWSPRKKPLSIMAAFERDVYKSIKELTEPKYAHPKIDERCWLRGTHVHL